VFLAVLVCMVISNVIFGWLEKEEGDIALVKEASVSKGRISKKI